ncbi:MAG: 16S rRNA (cytosine(1402)-N(4))-methyltransferase RsmH [Actinomycetota bacterium]
MAYDHEPVLLHEVLSWLSPTLALGLPVVDCTLGGGGHSEELLLAGATVIGIDRDQSALDASNQRLKRFGHRFIAVKGNLRQIEKVVHEQSHEQVAAVLYDLGVSSPQLDRAERGFGFRDDAPLDMRMDHSDTLRAADIVNNYSLSRLVEVIGGYGEERFARRVAKAIVSRRSTVPFEGTRDLAEVVKAAIPAATRRTGPHPARRTFQALRLEVNQELEALEASLQPAIDLLATGGRVAVISYHSLEDRIVKRTFVAQAKGCICPKDLPRCACGLLPEIRILTHRPVRPSPVEVERNKRSDSARLRVVEKLDAA